MNLSPDRQAELDGKITNRTLTEVDILDLAVHLHHARPRTAVLVPDPFSADIPVGAVAILRSKLAFSFACAAVNDSLVHGELPLCKGVKYLPEVLQPNVVHQNVLAKAAFFAEMLQARKAVVYADLGIDNHIREALALAKTLKLPVEVRVLRLPDFWGGKDYLDRMDEAKQAILSIKALPKSILSRSTARIAAKLAKQSLTAADLWAMVAYFRDGTHVVVESPFAPSNTDRNKSITNMEAKINHYYGCFALNYHLMRGELAYASHTKYTHTGILDDTIPHERTLGIAAGLAETFMGHKTVVHEDRQVSGGMKKGIAFAEKLGRPVERKRHAEWPYEFFVADADFWIGLHCP
ncbi:MAG: hypothetical protein GC134_07575 [Proteobacteria bacterium]|nr:hypothetical protein [Pseudomonadota bacterium]